MNAIIDGIAGDHQSDGWHMKTSRIVSVRMSDSYDDQFASFQIDLIAF
jgi:hypothetical protein